MRIIDHPDAWRRPQNVDSKELEQRVQQIVDRIQVHGEQALRILSQEIDGFMPRVIELLPWTQYPLARKELDWIQNAGKRIERFAKKQRACLKDLTFSDHCGSYGHRWLPLDRMGAYIPGGRYPLVSTALMTLVPARVAGVVQRVAVSPSDDAGVLAAASWAGATHFVQVGGAQAIAALAFGTECVPRVDMIVGPGNAYVNMAKRVVQSHVKIDSLAGPSELLVLCDQSSRAEWVAYDLLAQGEHDPLALAMCASTCRNQLEQVMSVIQRELGPDPKGRGSFQFVFCESRDDALHFANQVAAEHLSLAWQDPESDIEILRHYGSLFIGLGSPVALGDYCSGPNHTLPTLGNARMKAGLSVLDFLRPLTWQRIESSGYDKLAEIGMGLAKLEGLDYHYASLKKRR